MWSQYLWTLMIDSQLSGQKPLLQFTYSASFLFSAALEMCGHQERHCKRWITPTALYIAGTWVNRLVSLAGNGTEPPLARLVALKIWAEVGRERVWTRGRRQQRQRKRGCGEEGIKSDGWTGLGQTFSRCSCDCCHCSDRCQLRITADALQSFFPLLACLSRRLFEK